MTLVAAPPVSPYKGLAAFEDSELDALFFFGRQLERDALVANLLASRLTILYGESGVGKSSLLRAAVVRELREQAPDAVVTLHDTWVGPVGSIADDVADATEGYLILDQFEEYFLYHGDDTGGGTLLRDLPELLHGSSVNVLLSLREDALAQLDAFKARIPNVFANQVRLEHLDRRAARAAIVGPLERWNDLASEAVEIEPSLVDAVLDEVAVEGRSPDRDRIEAPYLQLVLERLWRTERAAESRFLRLDTLRALGGAKTIVRDHLQNALAALSPAEQDVATDIFEHLVTPSGTKIALGASDLAEYAGVSEDTLRRVLGTLTRDRIVHSVDGSDRHQIFHDVLIEPVRSWQLERRLVQERSQASRRQRRLMAVAVATAVALGIVAAIALFALAQRGDAREQARHARAEARHARAGELAANALVNLDADPVRSLQQALSAVRLERSPRAADVLRTALLGTHVRLVLPAHGAVMSASFAPDSRRVVVGGADGRVEVYDVQTTKRLLAFRVPGPVRRAAFSVDGRRVLAAGGGRVVVRGAGRPLVLRHPGLRDAEFGARGSEIVTGGEDGAVRLWRASDGRLLRTFSPGGRVTRVALASTGARLAAAWVGGGGLEHVALYDPSTGRSIGDLRGETLAFSPDGSFIATGHPDDFARLYDAATGRRLVLMSHGGPVTAVDFSDDGRELVTASADGAAREWDVAPGTQQFGQRLLLLPSGSTLVRSAHFSVDGRFVVSAGRDGVARVWNALNGRELVAFTGHRGAIVDASFSRNGRFVVTASNDGTARVWDTDLEDQLVVVGRTHGPVLRVGFEGDRMLAAARGGVSVWQASSRRLVESLPAASPAADGAVAGRWLALVLRGGAAALTLGGAGRKLEVPAPGVRTVFSPDGRTLLLAGGRVVELVPVRGGKTDRLRLPGRATDVRFAPGGAFAVATANGRVVLVSSRHVRLRVLAAGTQPITAVAFSRDAKRVAAAGRDGFAHVWSAVTGRLEYTLRRARTPLSDIEFSPDGRFVATATIGGDTRLWTAANGRLAYVLRGHTGRVAHMSFSPDAAWLVTAGPTSVGLWQTRTGHLLLYLRGHRGQVEDAEFAPDGLRIITGSVDATVRIYRCRVCSTVGELARVAQARLVHMAAQLTPRQRRRYLGG